MSDVQALYEKALREFRQDRVEEAIGLLEDILKREPGFVDAYEALALLYFRQKKLEEAIGIVREMIQRYPENIMAHTNLSRFYAAKGLIEEAEKEQAEARRLSWRAELAAKKAKGEAVQEEENEEKHRRILEEKIETYRKVIELDPKDVLGYFSLATAYFEGKMYGPARENFAKAVEVNPHHSPSWLGWGQSLEALGRKDEAMSSYRRGIPVAEKQGDIIPLKKMETRLARLEDRDGSQ